MNYPTQGAPQGGVGSPHLWSQVIDELLDQLDQKQGLIKVAYTENLAVLASSDTVTRSVDIVQEAINTCCQWGLTRKLRFSPSKTEAILFWKARKLDRASSPKLKIEDKTIEYKSKIKYLGLFYNERLDWLPHLRVKCGKAKKLLYKHRNGIGQWWGYRPISATYIWRGIVRPMLSYGCLVWNPVLRTKTVVLEL